MIYDIIIAPIEALVDWIFSFILNKVPQLGVIGAIVGVSIVINIIALPLYNIADAIQDRERKIKGRLEPRVKRIKRAFKGDEQFLILSEYYRQNGYHPLYVLRSATSLLIQIPFFMAAYNYLSESEVLRQSSFWIFSNLGAPDSLLNFNLFGLALSINVLPIIMTLINFVSGYIYTKEAALSDKVQLYGLGVFFLILLYASPSGLVIYWIMNNVFSLAKNVVLKTKRPGLVLHGLCSIVILAFGFFLTTSVDLWKAMIIIAMGFVFALFPYLYMFLNKTYGSKLGVFAIKGKNSFSIVALSGLGLAILCGFYLPSNTIASSPIEFSYLGHTSSPVSYVWSNLWFFLGLFCFWPLVIYKMFGEKVGKVEAVIMGSVFLSALGDAFVFPGNYGIIDTCFFPMNPSLLLSISKFEIIVPFIVIAFIFLFVYTLDHFGKSQFLVFGIISITIAELFLGIIKYKDIKDGFNSYSQNIGERDVNVSVDEAKLDSIYHLSKDKENVIVIFLDRAVSQFFLPSMELLEGVEAQFDGFVYYPNTLSFGSFTKEASPAMMGGYEYTPEKLYSSSDQLSFHNESQLVAPLLFSDGGFMVTMTDPPLPNYSDRGDLSAFDDYPQISVSETNGRYKQRFFKEIGYSNKDDADLETKKEARNFALMQVIPPLMRNIFNKFCRTSGDVKYQTFSSAYSSLYYLNETTDFEGNGSQYIFIGNDSTHEPCSLKANLLLPAMKGEDEIQLNIVDEDERVRTHYMSFLASMKALGSYFDYLRENHVWDNTRIIVVSDHGFDFEVEDGLDLKATMVNPLLLYKDFNSNGRLTIDYSFMTNADTLDLSKRGLDISNINPFTGEELKVEKDEVTIYTNGVYTVKDDIFSDSNWKLK